MSEQSFPPDHPANAAALWIAAPGVAEIRPAVAPPPRGGNVRVRALVSGISRGTESLVFNGLVPEREWSRMRCPFQEGDFSFPVKYGYAMVGQVEDGPAELLGRRVLSLHPHQTRFTLPVESALPIPDTVTSERAVLGPQMETALNATWDSGLCLGDRVAVVGGGVIGLLVAWLCARVPGVSVSVIDIDPSRRAIAELFGARFLTPGDAMPEGYDVVFHASASQEGLELALTLAGFEATIVELSWYGTKRVTVELGGIFHSGRLRLVGSQVGAVATPRRARRSHGQRLAQALALCADTSLDALVGEETPFADIPTRLPAILGRQGALCHLVRY